VRIVWVARTEEIGYAPLVDEQGHLRFADDEPAALLDLEVIRGEAPGEHIVAGLRPLQDVDELLLDEAQHAHARLRAVVGLIRAMSAPPLRSEATRVPARD
jgi:hypothetical protein